MNNWTKIFLSTSFLISIAYGDECICDLEPSRTYKGTDTWNCLGHALLSVPTQCFNENQIVTELILTNNLIESIQENDFDMLPYLKALYLDFNKITDFNQTALQNIPDLEILNLNENPALKFPTDTLTYDENLQEIYFVSSHIGILPNLTASPKLAALDGRSCSLTSLSRPLFGALTSNNFYLNFVGNNFVDVAADTLLPLPSLSTINLDSYVTIWATDEYQRYEVINKNWNINLDLDLNLKVCDYDGNPQDPAVC